MRKRAAAAGLAILLLAGCAVAPSVNYRLLSERPSSDAWVPYQLTDSAIVLGVVAGAPPPGAAAPASAHNETQALGVGLAPAELDCSDEGCQGATVGATAAAIAFQGETFGIEPRRSHFVRTILTPTYYPNSLRLKTLAIEGRDQRKEIIDTAGALAVGAARLARAAGDRSAGKPGHRTIHLPVVIDLAAAKQGDGGFQPLPGNPGWTYSGRFLDDPSRVGFRRRSEAREVHGAIVTSLCRPYQLTLTASGAVTITLGLTVADPDWLETVPFPAKGAVNFGPLCGADIQAQPVTETPTDVLVTDFFKQVDTLRAATGGARK